MAWGLPALVPTGPASSFEEGSGSCSVCSPALPGCVGKSCLPVPCQQRNVGNRAWEWAPLALAWAPAKPRAECSQPLSSSNPVTRPFALHGRPCASGHPLRALQALPASWVPPLGGGGGPRSHCTIRAGTEGCPCVAPGRRAVRSGILQPKSFFKLGKNPTF